MVLKLREAAEGIGIEPLYQPIVTLPSEEVVGYEALARWPASNALGPESVFAHARETGRIDQLDTDCIKAAVDTALNQGLPRGTLLCVNTEPNTTHIGVEEGALVRGQEELQLTFELTERGLLSHPHLLLRKVAALRADGFAVALDDVGAHPDSLALLDVVAPDIIKLDLALIQTRPDRDRARTLSAVLAHHERTGAVILAEGIETADHLEQALALGARLGQGYLFGRPEKLDRHPVTDVHPLPDCGRRPVRESTVSPFDLVAGRCPVRTARKEILTAFSRHIEEQARYAADPPIVLTTLQHADYFTPTTAQRYRDLAARTPLVAVFGQDLSTDLGARVRGVPIDSADPLCTEWTVVTLGAHASSALIAREHREDSVADTGDDHRRFDFVITYDRSLVTAAACNLLNRIG